MAKQTGVLVDDDRLRGRDNSFAGLDRSADFGDGGKVTGGEPSNTDSAADSDEFMAGSRSSKRGM